MLGLEGPKDGKAERNKVNCPVKYLEYHNSRGKRTLSFFPDSSEGLVVLLREF